MSEQIVVKRKHSWGVLVAYILTQREARQSVEESLSIDTTKALTTDGPVCLHCGAGWNLWDKSCPGITDGGIIS